MDTTGFAHVVTALGIENGCKTTVLYVIWYRADPPRWGTVSFERYDAKAVPKDLGRAYLPVFPAGPTT